MRLKIIGIVESIQAQRDEDAALPQRASIGLRLVGEVNKAAERLEFKLGRDTGRDGEIVKAVTIATDYGHAQGLSVGDEIVIVAFQRGWSHTEDECWDCGSSREPK